MYTYKERGVLLPRTVTLKKGPDVVFLYLLASPGGFAEEGEARSNTRLVDKAPNFDFLSQCFPPIVCDEFLHNGL